MDKFVITGRQPLSGSVKIEGSKNAVLPILAATLLVEKGTTVIHNVPDLVDIDTFLKVIAQLGAKVNHDRQAKTVSIEASTLTKYEAPYDLVRKMRASFLVLGPLIARLGKARVSLPGGCVIGPRPVNLHVYGFQRLGAQLSEDRGYIVAEVPPATGQLVGTTICFDRPTHTGTENLMIAACLAKGKTTLVNAACDPEVVDVANYLNATGGKVEGAGTSTVTITGVRRLHPVEYTPMPDRLESATFLMAAAVTGGYVEIDNGKPEHLDMVVSKLTEMGADIHLAGSRLKVKGPNRLKAVSVTTYPFPGFPTDLQPQLMALCAVANGTSHVRETVFEDRFTHVMEMLRLGADIKVARDEATIHGVAKLKGASVMASDIRAGAGLVLAGLAAEGETEVLRVYHIDRGYNSFEEKLSHLGASIKRVAA